MTWSFDPTNAGTSTASARLDAVRTLLQDVDTNDQQMQDEQIAFFLEQAGDDIYMATAMAADTLAGKYARYGDTSIDDGGISVDFKDVADGYRALALQMRRASQQFGSAGVGVPRAGGVSRAGMNTVYQNTDRVDPAFRHRQFRNPHSDNDDDDRIR